MRALDRIRVILLASAAVCALLPGTAAQDTSVRSYITPRQGITVNVQIELVIEVRGGIKQMTRPDLTGLSNLKVVAGPREQTAFSSVNGRASTVFKLVYTLLPERAGRADIPALDLTVDMRKYRTEPIVFKVGEAAAAPNDPVYLRAELGKKRIWVGEPVSLQVTLFTVPTATGFDFRQIPEFSNFWVENVKADGNSEAYQVGRGSQIYTAHPVERKILIPTTAGTFTIDPYVAMVSVRRSRGNSFDFFGLGRAESVVCRTEQLAIEVLDLPQEGRPADFSGAVGSYTMTVNVDRDQTRVNDAVALEVAVTGEGALQAVDPPHFQTPASLKVFDPRVEEAVLTIEEGKVLTTKTWEWIIIPLVPGDMQLPEVQFDYFDTASAAYKSVTGGGQMLSVERGEPPESGTAKIKLGNGGHTELAFIKPLRGRLEQGNLRSHQSTVFRTLVFLPAFITPLYILFGRRKARMRKDLGLSRSRRARRLARRRLKHSRKRLDKIDSASFHEELARTLVGFVADRSNLSAAGMTYDTADELLGAKGADPELRRRFRSTLENCDFARFVPTASLTERRTEVLEAVTALIEDLERTL
jgi:hypothetical protein